MDWAFVVSGAALIALSGISLQLAQRDPKLSRWNTRAAWQHPGAGYRVPLLSVIAGIELPRAWRTVTSQPAHEQAPPSKRRG
jgi:hypothetical protein